jgi:hypothetical protein
MSCTRCLSLHQTALNSEINLHFRGLPNLGEPGLFVFPQVLVCLDCGLSEFVIEKRELAQIIEKKVKRRVVGAKSIRTVRRKTLDAN